MLLEDMMKKQPYRQSARRDGTAKEGKTKCTTDWRRESGEHLMFMLHVSILSGRLRVSNALVGESCADH